jgi:hypothetical protein
LQLNVGFEIDQEALVTIFSHTKYLSSPRSLHQADLLDMQICSSGRTTLGSLWPAAHDHMRKENPMVVVQGHISQGVNMDSNGYGPNSKSKVKFVSVNAPRVTSDSKRPAVSPEQVL